MAAAYAALVPLVEIPSGILADRWSRRGVLIVASTALMLTSLVGGLSNSVPLYIVSALFLAVYFAMYSGTLEAVVYDTLLEETGASDGFERRHRPGALRRERDAWSPARSPAACSPGSTTPRLTYFLTVPFALASIVALLRFDEPQLHKTEESTSLRSHIAVTYRTITRRRDLLPVVVLTMLTALMLQVIFEFGPLWLVASGTSPGLYGPFWAGLVSTLGLGGLLAGRMRFDRPATLTATIAVLILASLVLTVSRQHPRRDHGPVRGGAANGHHEHLRLAGAPRRGAVADPLRCGLRCRGAVVDRLPAVLAAVRPREPSSTGSTRPPG